MGADEIDDVVANQLRVIEDRFGAGAGGETAAARRR
jgi:hypothetical protein